MENKSKINENIYKIIINLMTGYKNPAINYKVNKLKYKYLTQIL